MGLQDESDQVVKALGTVHEFYDRSWKQLIGLMKWGFGIVAVALPIIVLVSQSFSLKNEADSLKSELRAESTAQLTTLKSELHAESNTQLTMLKSELRAESNSQLVTLKNDFHAESDAQLATLKNKIRAESDAQLAQLKSELLANSSAQLASLKREILANSDAQLAILKSKIREESTTQIADTTTQIVTGVNDVLKRLQDALKVTFTQASDQINLATNFDRAAILLVMGAHNASIHGYAIAAQNFANSGSLAIAASNSEIEAQACTALQLCLPVLKAKDFDGAVGAGIKKVIQTLITDLGAHKDNKDYAAQLLLIKPAFEKAITRN